MRYILTIILLFQLSFSFAEKATETEKEKLETLESLVINLKNDVTVLQNKVIEQNRRLQSREDLNEKTINGICAQISASSYNLTIFGLLFAVLAILLGVYITRIENKVVKISEHNKLLHTQTLKQKEEVVEINNLIQKDILGLYQKIRREETVHILNRLLEVPEDVTHLQSSLLSRTLEKEDYIIVKDAYKEIKKQPIEPRGLFGSAPSYKDYYMLIFFQHFLDLAIIDKDINKEISDFLMDGVRSCFKNDIIKSTTDFMNALVKFGYSKKNREINNYIRGISQTKFKDFDIVYDIIFDALNNRDDQFNFFKLIDDDKKSRVGKANYGSLLSRKYSNQKPSANEKAVFAETQTILEELEAEETARVKAEEKRKAVAEAKKKAKEEAEAKKNKKTE